MKKFRNLKKNSKSWNVLIKNFFVILCLQAKSWEKIHQTPKFWVFLFHPFCNFYKGWNGLSFCACPLPLVSFSRTLPKVLYLRTPAPLFAVFCTSYKPYNRTNRHLLCNRNWKEHTQKDRPFNLLHCLQNALQRPLNKVLRPQVHIHSPFHKKWLNFVPRMTKYCVSAWYRIKR